MITSPALAHPVAERRLEAADMARHLRLADHRGRAADLVVDELDRRGVFEDRAMAVRILQHLARHAGHQRALAIAGAAGDQHQALIWHARFDDLRLDRLLGERLDLVWQGTGNNRATICASREHSGCVDPEAHARPPVGLDLVGHVEVLALLQPRLAVRAIERVDGFLDLALGQGPSRNPQQTSMKLDADRLVRLEPYVRGILAIGPGKELVQAVAREGRALARPKVLFISECDTRKAVHDCSP